MVSNAFCKSIKTTPVKRPFSNPVVILSVRCPRQVFISEMSKTIVSRVVFPKTQVESAQNFVLTQKLFILIMNSPFNNF